MAIDLESAIDSLPYSQRRFTTFAQLLCDIMTVAQVLHLPKLRHLYCLPVPDYRLALVQLAADDYFYSDAI